ncbi:DNA replication/repair protein RecF [Aquisalinus flavus]|uniref:DNA replication and repair protein RecF n=1 Tax=Aquisalinus flavus TaxID=1526572 RepID=A0A8J2Y408_9PROT|nr:DNA replication/repair protein RecF [Aquisalinus flavus]MBD0425871.1 DNA replication/repair protein RecF [Aquisalinus flavus]UNE48532.1 DNA replication/repair protein RecF [Aquisalinus flavus]GGD12589.1 DNA replication and repair protein RecF [Aquisalinus flavus]
MSFRIRRITLTDFRSYAGLDLALDGRPVVLTGPNGAGKTNLLEALSMVSAGRGMRGAKMDELARLGSPGHPASGGWSVSAVLEDRYGGETRLGTGIAPAPDSRGETKRVTRIDGSPASGPTALLDYLRFVWLTPAQDRLFMEGASERRRFLDRMTMSHDPAHGRAAATYEKAMRQRTKVLERWPQVDETLLGVLETQMAEAGVAMAAARLDMARRLAAGARQIDEAVFPAAGVALDGTLEEQLQSMKAAEVEEAFEARLRAMRPRDAEAGRALAGPHRTDLLVTHKAKGQAARLCSTGEQKALLIGLVLANARSLRQEASDIISGVPLVLLLDEIAAHLDPDRRAALFDILEETGLQVFMTGTDPDLFAAWGRRAQSFTVRDGMVKQAG